MQNKQRSQKKLFLTFFKLLCKRVVTWRLVGVSIYTELIEKQQSCTSQSPEVEVTKILGHANKAIHNICLITPFYQQFSNFALRIKRATKNKIHRRPLFLLLFSCRYKNPCRQSLLPNSTLSE